MSLQYLKDAAAAGDPKKLIRYGGSNEWGGENRTHGSSRPALFVGKSPDTVLRLLPIPHHLSAHYPVNIDHSLTYAVQSALRGSVASDAGQPTRSLIMMEAESDRRPHPALDAVRSSQGRVTEKLAQAAERLRRVESMLRRPLEGNHTVEPIALPSAEPGALEPAPVAAVRDEKLGSGEAPYLLVVDGAEASRSALAYLLRDHGYTVREAGSAQQLPSDGETTPALVIFDPGPFLADALAATSTMASRSGWEAIPVLLIGSTAAGDERDRALAAGCVECLPKPCQPVELTAAVERIVGAPACGVMARMTPHAAAAGE